MACSREVVLVALVLIAPALASAGSDTCDASNCPSEAPAGVSLMQMKPGEHHAKPVWKHHQHNSSRVPPLRDLSAVEGNKTAEELDEGKDAGKDEGKESGEWEDKQEQEYTKEDYEKDWDKEWASHKHSHYPKKAAEPEVRSWAQLRASLAGATVVIAATFALF